MAPMKKCLNDDIFDEHLLFNSLALFLCTLFDYWNIRILVYLKAAVIKYSSPNNCEVASSNIIRSFDVFGNLNTKYSNTRSQFSNVLAKSITSLPVHLTLDIHAFHHLQAFITLIVMQTIPPYM